MLDCFSFKIATFERWFFLLGNFFPFSVSLARRFFLYFLFIISYYSSLKIYSNDAGCCWVLDLWLFSIFRSFLAAQETRSSNSIGSQYVAHFFFFVRGHNVNKITWPIFGHCAEHAPFKERTLPIQAAGLAVAAHTSPGQLQPECVTLSLYPQQDPVLHPAAPWTHPAESGGIKLLCCLTGHGILSRDRSTDVLLCR